MSLEWDTPEDLKREEQARWKKRTSLIDKFKKISAGTLLSIFTVDDLGLLKKMFKVKEWMSGCDLEKVEKLYRKIKK
jgi:hypothetical protein